MPVSLLFCFPIRLAVRLFASLVFCNEGFAVGAFTYCRIGLMSANLNFIKCAIIGGFDVILALSYRAGDAVVCCLVFHGSYS